MSNTYVIDVEYVVCSGSGVGVGVLLLRIGSSSSVVNNDTCGVVSCSDSNTTEKKYINFKYVLYQRYLIMNTLNK